MKDNSIIVETIRRKVAHIYEKSAELSYMRIMEIEDKSRNIEEELAKLKLDIKVANMMVYKDLSEIAQKEFREVLDRAADYIKYVNEPSTFSQPNR